MPGVHPLVHAAALALLAVLLVLVARRVLRWRASRTASTGSRAVAFDARPGWATREAVRRSSSTRTLMAQAPLLRPSLEHAAA